MKITDLLPLMPWEGPPIPRFLCPACMQKVDESNQSNQAEIVSGDCNVLWTTWRHKSKYANQAISSIVAGTAVSPRTQNFWAKNGLNLQDLKQCINEQRTITQATLSPVTVLYYPITRKQTVDILKRAKERDETIKIKGGTLAFTDSSYISQQLVSQSEDWVILKLDVPEDKIISCYKTNPALVDDRQVYLVVWPYIKVEPKEIIDESE